ncbi:DUF1572 family protein [Pseudozobellia thermophila]|uniref:DUF1572 domain-containing protein n=1 Tax=Pseudozobellia thermophila TaxID=192903 RepID=A0A1M6MJ68_9FLAO|nr:DUF1572 family protein [Pseudozobellia thermophila]SHJ83508.1 Protein of unknown function [Pseudozobellia thermophila]
MNFVDNYLDSVIFEFHRYKALGDKSFAQLGEADILWKHGANDNNIALIVKHLSGNMLSRWTRFLTEDGEKSWRHRENEFEHPYATKKEMLLAWEKGWACLFEALGSIDGNNFETRIKIRNEEHTLIEAINRQLAHYANHVGQIVLLAKMIKGDAWQSLSIPRGGSEKFNRDAFGA